MVNGARAAAARPGVWSGESPPISLWLRVLGSTCRTQPLCPPSLLCFLLQNDSCFPQLPVVNTGRARECPAGPVASLADVGQLEAEERDARGRKMFSPDSGLFLRTQQLRRRPSLPSMPQVAATPGQTLDSDAILKIGALETELANLRAQIAQILQAQESTARIAVREPEPPPPPCPPPPPPPPPPLPASHTTTSAIDLIRQRREKTAAQPIASLESDPRGAEMPNMLEVLRDIGKVKLRSVSSSRREDASSKPVCSKPTDAATLIAQALKRKFAHCYCSDSDAESPEKKTGVAFGQHLLRATGRKNLD